MVTVEDIQEASQRIGPVIRTTPLFHSHALSRRVGTELFLKAEMLQRTGSFKIRGAYNKISQLSTDQKHRGVIAASAGNHAQGVAVAARLAGTPATVVMPSSAPHAKVAASRAYGAEVILHGDHYHDAAQLADRIRRERGLTLIPGFDDPDIIAGQGTIGLEILADLPELDELIVPVGGGGLIAGIAIAVKSARPNVRLVGVQSASAPSLVASLRAGHPVTVEVRPTIADGIAVEQPGALPFEIIQAYVDDVVTVTEDQIRVAISALLQRSKVVAEGAGGTALAAVIAAQATRHARRVVLVLSGGNIDLDLLAEIAGSCGSFDG